MKKQNTQNHNINIGIIGLGTVGQGVIQILEENKDFIGKKIYPQQLKVKKIADKDINKISSYAQYSKLFTNSAEEVLNDSEIDIIVELIGGFEPAKSFIIQALQSGKHVVTANKEVIARAGYEILDVAKKNKRYFLFEASVASAIPIIGAVTRSLTSYRLREIVAILNGTTNYILSQMSEEGKDFNEILKEAQDRGYAESDPAKDINGFDTFNKIFVLSAIAFRAKIDPNQIYYEGIEDISPLDIQYGKELGYTLKLYSSFLKRGQCHQTQVLLLLKDHYLLL